MSGRNSIYDVGVEQTTSHRKSGGGGGLLFGMLLFGFGLLAIVTYLPGQLDDRYAGSGQVISMVNPGGNPEADMQYAEVNQGNANANLTNAEAYQKQTFPWIAMFAIAGILAIVFVLIQGILRSIGGSGE